MWQSRDIVFQNKVCYFPVLSDSQQVFYLDRTLGESPVNNNLNRRRFLVYLKSQFSLTFISSNIKRRKKKTHPVKHWNHRAQQSVSPFLKISPFLRAPLSLGAIPDAAGLEAEERWMLLLERPLYNTQGKAQLKELSESGLCLPSAAAQRLLFMVHTSPHLKTCHWPFRSADKPIP